MMDREKLITGLELCTNISPDGCLMLCPYKDEKDETYSGFCEQVLKQDALALLKEQEVRILDWDELEDWENAVWFEDKDEHECYIALIARVGTYSAKFTNVEPGNIHSLAFMREFYMKEWRCWSARPTIKQRQEVNWE